MNQEQRKRLEKILEELTELQQQEQDKYDNMPENLMYSEKAEKFQENADSIQEAIDIIYELLEGE